MSDILFYPSLKTISDEDALKIFSNFTKNHEDTNRIFQILRTAQIRSFNVHNWQKVLAAIAFVKDCKSVTEEAKELAIVSLLFKDLFYVPNSKLGVKTSGDYTEELLFKLGIFNQKPSPVWQIVNTINRSSSVLDYVASNDVEKLVYDAENTFLAIHPISFDVLMSNLAIENGFLHDSFLFHSSYSKTLAKIFLPKDDGYSLPVFFTSEGLSYEAAAISNIKRYLDVDKWVETHRSRLEK